MTQINLSEIFTLFTPLTEDSMVSQWDVLHSGDVEPVPTDPVLMAGWLDFHNGTFDRAIAAAKQGGTEGLSLLLKSEATQAFYLLTQPAQKANVLKKVVEQATAKQFEDVGVTYQLAYALGRYGQTISIAKALAEGLAGQLEKAITWVLKQCPNHADAHTAYAMYQAEIIGKLGKLAAKLTYGVSIDSAVEHFERGIELAPLSVSARTSYADGLLLMYGSKKRQVAIDWYQQAAQQPPYDALSALDVQLAKLELLEC